MVTICTMLESRFPLPTSISQTTYQENTGDSTQGTSCLFDRDKAPGKCRYTLMKGTKGSVTTKLFHTQSIRYKQIMYLEDINLK